MTLPLPHPRRGLLLAALLLTLSAPLMAQDTARSAESAPAAEPLPTKAVSVEAQAVLDRMTTYLQGLQDFTIESDATRDEVVSSGYKLQHNEHATLTVQRPGKLRAEVAGDIRNRTFIYDGSKLVIYSPDDQVYASVPATGSLKELIGGLLDAGVELPLIDVLYQASAGTLTEAVRGGVLAGEALIDGVECDHLAFRQDNADWQLWVEKGPRALPRKVVITTRNEVGDPQFQAQMSWNLQPKFTADTFAFTPAKGVEQIAFADAAAVQKGSK